ncbi:MAG: hypothetical protein ACREGJ_00600 [Candidatus Saccharimonadales bacterium]
MRVLAENVTCGEALWIIKNFCHCDGPFDPFPFKGDPFAWKCTEDYQGKHGQGAQCRNTNRGDAKIIAVRT